MARLSWGAPSDRLYETGLDRGVLYTTGNPGVAWPGLVSITETPSGGSSRPFYIDGIKYLNLAAVEEYGATLNSFYPPAEFLACDGILQIHTGLFAAEQRRRSFGFSYRTRIGNALQGSSHGYKIHLVYNALAAPSQRNMRSLDDAGSPAIFSWRLSTLAPPITGYRRTAHMIVDSRLTDPLILTEVEDLLYGTPSSNPTLPTPDELIAIFAP